MWEIHFHDKKNTTIFAIQCFGLDVPTSIEVGPFSTCGFGRVGQYHPTRTRISDDPGVFWGKTGGMGAFFFVG